MKASSIPLWEYRPAQNVELLSVMNVSCKNIRDLVTKISRKHLPTGRDAPSARCSLKKMEVVIISLVYAGLVFATSASNSGNLVIFVRESEMETTGLLSYPMYRLQITRNPILTVSLDLCRFY